MENETKDKSSSIKNLKDFFNSKILNESKKKASQDKIIQNQLLKVTGGNNIVLSNNCK